MLENFQAPIGDQVASARVTAAGAFVGERVGFVSVVLALNVFTLVLSNRIDRTDSTIKLGCADGTAVQFHHTVVNDFTIEVRGFIATTGAAANAAFYVEIDRKAVG